MPTYRYDALYEYVTCIKEKIPCATTENILLDVNGNKDLLSKLGVESVSKQRVKNACTWGKIRTQEKQVRGKVKELTDYAHQLIEVNPGYTRDEIANEIIHDKELHDKLGLHVDWQNICPRYIHMPVGRALTATSIRRENYQVKKSISEAKQERTQKRKRFERKNLDTILSVFDKGICSSKYLSDNIFDKYGMKISHARIENSLKSLGCELGANSPIVFRSENKIEGMLYKLNKKSPYWGLCDGFAKEEKVQHGI